MRKKRYLLVKNPYVVGELQANGKKTSQTHSKALKFIIFETPLFKTVRSLILSIFTLSGGAFYNSFQVTFSDALTHNSISLPFVTYMLTDSGDFWIALIFKRYESKFHIILINNLHLHPPEWPSKRESRLAIQ